VHVPRVGIHHRDHPVGSHLAGDPEGPRLLARLDILASHQPKQPDRLGLVGVQLRTLHGGQHRQRVGDQRAHQSIASMGIVPGALRLAGWWS
jgi:hypothetical protein